VDEGVVGAHGVVVANWRGRSHGKCLTKIFVSWKIDSR